MEISFEVQVGRLLCRSVREMLESEVFYGRKIRFREGNGWISRTFYVIGEKSDIEMVKIRLEHYIKCLNADSGRLI